MWFLILALPGQVVEIKQPANYLSLAEVEVYGTVEGYLVNPLYWWVTRGAGGTFTVPYLTDRPEEIFSDMVVDVVVPVSTYLIALFLERNGH